MVTNPTLQLKVIFILDCCNMNSLFLIFLTISLNSRAIRAFPTPDEKSHNIRFHSYSGPLLEKAVESEFSRAKSLEIRLSNISGLSREVLGKFKNIQLLSIVFSRIQKTEDNIFENCCPKLKQIEIRKWVDFNQKDLRGIGTLPVEKLEILDENIPILTEDMFENTELRELKLIRDNIQTIEPSAFSKLINLEYLLLAQNKVTSFPKEALSPLKNLKSLELVSNGLTSLTTDDLPELPSLRNITIINESLKLINLTDVKTKAPNLAHVNLIGNVGVQVYGINTDHAFVPCILV